MGWGIGVREGFQLYGSSCSLSPLAKMHLSCVTFPQSSAFPMTESKPDSYHPTPYDSKCDPAPQPTPGLESLLSKGSSC